mmetsp:Transcript_6652/g.11195  ORF Transcript_6652/g.11195 Transcript_6652/m.11195 type:complete len:82 (+) Transcript_6652:1284-1529(+)
MTLMNEVMKVLRFNQMMRVDVEEEEEAKINPMNIVEEKTKPRVAFADKESRGTNRSKASGFSKGKTLAAMDLTSTLLRPTT